ncbi:MAG: hypothetical protein AB7Q37_07000 [Pyrinomonadaceae bacterium]
MSSRREFALDGIDEDLILVGLTDRNELEAIVVTLSGYVFLIDLATGKSFEIGKLSFEPFTQARRQRIFSAGLQFHSFRDYVAIVQVYGQSGTVFHLSNPAYSKHLDRQNYHPDVCKFPVAFVDRGAETWLIHATDWNRLDITRLEGDELLTDRVVSCETNENYFDYFHCGLSVAPDSKAFVSNGWHWHPFGQITFYSIDEFLKNFEMAHVDLCLTDAGDSPDAMYDLGWDRPLCWIDSRNIAVGYSRGEGWYGKRTLFQSEILIYDVESNRIDDRIRFDGFGVCVDGEVTGDLFFDELMGHFICLNEKTGLQITDISGRAIRSEPGLTGWKYNSLHRLLYRVDEKEKRIVMTSIDMDRT